MKRIILPLLLTTALAGLPAIAQVRSEVDRLLELSGSTHNLRSYDPANPAAKRYALVIGNSEYAAISDLPNAAADANAFADFLRAQGYIVHHREEIRATHDKLGPIPHALNLAVANCLNG